MDRRSFLKTVCAGSVAATLPKQVWAAVKTRLPLGRIQEDYWHRIVVIHNNGKKRYFLDDLEVSSFDRPVIDIPEDENEPVRFCGRKFPDREEFGFVADEVTFETWGKWSNGEWATLTEMRITLIDRSAQENWS